jgi:predicted TPR repeat methyltransferase
VDCGADWPDVHARLGDLARQAGDADRAGRHYRRALELNGEYQHAARRLASLAA